VAGEPDGVTLTAEGTQSGSGPLDPGPLEGVPVARTQLGGRSIDVVESHTTRWLFDRDRRRLLRLPRDVDLDVGVLALPWQRYTDVTAAGERSLLVTLDDGARLHLNSRSSA
jgi:hypothetical protein